MNNIKDKGGAKLFRDISENKTLVSISVACNGLGSGTA